MIFSNKTQKWNTKGNKIFTMFWGKEVNNLVIEKPYKNWTGLREIRKIFTNSPTRYLRRSSFWASNFVSTRATFMEMIYLSIWAKSRMSNCALCRKSNSSFTLTYKIGNKHCRLLTSVSIRLLLSFIFWSRNWN